MEETMLDTSLWMCLMLASLVPFVQKLLLLELNLTPMFLGFAEALAVYSIDRYRDNLQCKDLRAQQATSRLLGAPLVGLALRHAVAGADLEQEREERTTWRIKELPCSKAFFVAFSTSFMALFAPLAYANSRRLPAGPAWRESAQALTLVFLISFSVENLQDVRDLDSDRAAGTVTLALKLGVRRTKCLLTSLWFLFAAMQVRANGAKSSTVQLLVALTVVSLTWSPVIISSKFFYSLLLESVFASPLLFSLLLDLLSSPSYK
ncbi:hypothetical protein GUITHDRAFT_106120 [Guillardia theta CCMP2712]|uniref:Uncharacterized protein n=1 Tax=Guillardia theta (strain CCMP2712) TaxID=905079 RepID=L1JHR2_GUITC|nr:hypothetical protein GUITHDRAFT_106120 [Guillardia theta CCMP2712]EKX48036.1 hypothetical protein GUITHDRAFT_106120 [Guillardia theta CCMP2712]|eukprot:XP_005835016.1 hypothetical protein GUITHDRAFT_106120 [Guillardia theta CCMP2712]